MATRWLSSALRMGVPVEELRALATDVRNWTQFRAGLEELIERHRVLQEESMNESARMTAPACLTGASANQSVALNKEETSPSSLSTAEVRTGLDYSEEAVILLKRCRAQGESWITIDFEDRVYISASLRMVGAPPFRLTIISLWTSLQERLKGTFDSSRRLEMSVRAAES
jgi:hypothetical protein